MVQFFCPNCFARVPSPHGACPACGLDSREWVEHCSYTDRLIHALDHPISEVRMAVVISLDNRDDPSAALPLARCALKHPTDIVLAMEITTTLKKFPAGPERNEAIAMLKTHRRKQSETRRLASNHSLDSFRMQPNYKETTSATTDLFQF